MCSIFSCDRPTPHIYRHLVIYTHAMIMVMLYQCMMCFRRCFHAYFLDFSPSVWNFRLNTKDIWVSLCTWWSEWRSHDNDSAWCLLLSSCVYNLDSLRMYIYISSALKTQRPLLGIAKHATSSPLLLWLLHPSVCTACPIVCYRFSTFVIVELVPWA